jgi:hypothetical protein
MVFLVNHPQIKYQFWLSIPGTPKRLVFWFHGSTTASQQELAEKRPIEFELALRLLPVDCVVVTPLIPKMTAEEIGRVIDPQCLCRNVMFDDLIDPAFGVYNRPDLEILKILRYLKEFIFPIIGTDFDSFAAGGFSAGGNFCSLFSVLHPQYVTHVISMLGCSFCLPVERVDGVPFDFPFGRGRLAAISEISPNLERQKQIRYFFYHGELDMNDPIEYFANYDRDEAMAIRSVVGQNTIERVLYCTGVFERMGFQVQRCIVPGVGHAISDSSVVHKLLGDFLAA